MIRLVIDSRLSRDSFDVGIPDDILVEAFETKQTLAAVLLNCKSRGEEEIDHSIRFTRDMCEELQWFDNDIVAKMALLDNDSRMPFLIKLSENDNDICSLISVLDFVPKWILNSVKRGEVLDEKRISEAYIGFWKAIMEHEQYTDVHLQKKINVVAVLLLNHLTENNEELNDIPDPRLHDYEVKVPISLILHKVIFKSRVLIRLFKDRLGGLFCSDSLFSPDLDIDSCLIRLGSCVQLAFLSDMESFGGKRHGKERCSEDTKNLLEILRQRVDQVVQNRPSEDMFILQQLRELLEMN
uniref:Uncharacterized protein n=1 Tax=Heterorhabditis bacteriophora TaxID=37862 RepID=A0A1I7XL82_HETBA